MENDELIKVWKKVDSDINQRSREELNLLLTSKAKQTVNKFVLIIGVSALVSLGLIIYLIITSVNRQDDLIYLINNMILGGITMVALISGLFSWYKVSQHRYDQPLEGWLDMRIKLLAKWLQGKLSKVYLFLLPLLYVLTVLSIHVYFENKTFIEVLHNEESVIGLIVAAPIGIFAAYFSVRKIRKYQLRNLEFLKELHQRLVS